MTTQISGSTGIDKVQDGTITNADISASAAIAGSKVDIDSSGTLLQTVTATSGAGTYVGSGTAWDDITGMNVTITPSKSTSKVMVSWHASVMVNPVSGSTPIQCRLMRGSTEVHRLGDNYCNESDAWRTYVESGVFIDAPATTSATNYKIQFSTGGSTTDSNVRINEYSGNLFIQVTEIGG